MKEAVRNCKEIARFRSLQDKHCVGGGGALLNKEGVVVCLFCMKAYTRAIKAKIRN